MDYENKSMAGACPDPDIPPPSYEEAQAQFFQKPAPFPAQQPAVLVFEASGAERAPSLPTSLATTEKPQNCSVPGESGGIGTGSAAIRTANGPQEEISIPISRPYPTNPQGYMPIPQEIAPRVQQLVPQSKSNRPSAISVIVAAVVIKLALVVLYIRYCT